MDSSLVSIIIPLYNSEKYIVDSIKSALDQSWPYKEIIIIDDGSEDGSLEIAKKFEAENIKIFSQKNKGASSARNKGLEEAKGSYIQFLDADDLLSPDKIENQLKFLDKYPDYISTCETIYFFDGITDNTNTNLVSGDSGKIYGSFEFMLGILGVEKAGMRTIHSWLTPRAIIDKAGFWNEELTVDDDGEYFCRVILNSAGVISCANSFNYYRKAPHYKSLSSQLNEKAYASMLTSISLKYSYLLTKTDETAQIDKIFSRHYWRTGVAAYPQFMKLSKFAINKARQLGFNGCKYEGGPLANLANKLFGWKITRILIYVRHGF